MMISTTHSTATESVEGFKVINETFHYKEGERDKASRLSEVSKDITSYPYVVEIFVKSNDGIFQYRTGESFESIKEAQKYQSSINVMPIKYI